MEDPEDPRGVWRLTAALSCEVRAGVVEGWLRAAKRVGVELQWHDGALGAYQSSQLSAQISKLRDALQHADETAIVAVSNTEIPLGEWWYRSVACGPEGVFFGGARVVSWEPAWCETERGRVRTSPVLLGFAGRAGLRAENAAVAWAEDLDAVARTAGSGATVGTLLVERVAP